MRKGYKKCTECGNIFPEDAMRYFRGGFSKKIWCLCPLCNKVRNEK